VRIFFSFLVGARASQSVYANICVQNKQVAVCQACAHIFVRMCVWRQARKTKTERMCGVQGRAKAAECHARIRHFPKCQPSTPQKPDVFWGVIWRVRDATIASGECVLLRMRLRMTHATSECTLQQVPGCLEHTSCLSLSLSVHLSWPGCRLSL
jgi:hypothetical protein